MYGYFSQITMRWYTVRFNFYRATLC